jgi:hypothetical protein
MAERVKIPVTCRIILHFDRVKQLFLEEAISIVVSLSE